MSVAALKKFIQKYSDKHSQFNDALLRQWGMKPEPPKSILGQIDDVPHYDPTGLAAMEEKRRGGIDPRILALLGAGGAAGGLAGVAMTGDD